MDYSAICLGTLKHKSCLMHEFEIAVDELRSMESPIKRRILNGKMFTVNRSLQRCAPVTLTEDGRICVHCLRDGSAPSNSCVVMHEDLLKVEEYCPKIAFIELGVKGKSLGRFIIRLISSNRKAYTFSSLCTGDHEYSLLNTNITEILNKGKMGDEKVLFEVTKADDGQSWDSLFSEGAKISKLLYDAVEEAATNPKGDCVKDSPKLPCIAGSLEVENDDAKDSQNLVHATRTMETVHSEVDDPKEFPKMEIAPDVLELTKTASEALDTIKTTSEVMETPNTEVDSVQTHPKLPFAFGMVESAKVEDCVQEDQNLSASGIVEAVESEGNGLKFTMKSEVSNSSNKSKDIIGNIEEGLNILLTVIGYEDVSNVSIIDCGIIMSALKKPT